MTSEHVLPDPATDFGKTLRTRLREEEAIWLTTVTAAGTPQPNPVWFLWQEDPEDPWGDGSFLIYNLNTAKRLQTLTERPKVSLSLNYRGGTGGLAVFTGSVEILEGHPPAHEVPAYAEKYRSHVGNITGDQDGLEAFMGKYSVVTRLRPTRVRGF